MQGCLGVHNVQDLLEQNVNALLYTIFLGKSQTENCQLCCIISGTWPAEGAGAQESGPIIAGMLRLINCNIASFSSVVSLSCLPWPGQPRVSTKSSLCYQYFCHNIPRPDYFLLSLGCQFILIHDSSLHQSDFLPKWDMFVLSTCQLHMSRHRKSPWNEVWREDKGRPVLPHTLMSGVPESVGCQPIRGEYGDTRTNQRSGKLDNGGRCEGRRRASVGVCAASPLCLQMKRFDIIWTYLEFITMLLCWDAIRG